MYVEYNENGTVSWFDSDESEPEEFDLEPEQELDFGS
tara:strand:+ start:7359 stop:7469 length:111 start_codon:yes stop_codon:yes gene_type:complete